MSTYRFKNYENCWGDFFFCIQRKNFWGNWVEEKRWKYYDAIDDHFKPESYLSCVKKNKRLLMMECVERLVTAGNTVI